MVVTLLATALIAAQPALAEETRPDESELGWIKNDTGAAKALLLPAVQKFAEEQAGIEPDEIDSKFISEQVHALLLPAVQKVRTSR